MRLSKMEFIALIVALFVGLHFYNQYKLEKEGFDDTSTTPLYIPGDKPPVIVAFGDSLTAGSGVPKDLSYPSQLSEMLGFEVINTGVANERTSDAVRRFPSVLNRYKPDIIIIAEGYDDLLTGRKRSKIRENLKKMVETAKKGGAKVIVIGMPDIDLIDLMITSDIGLYEEVAQEEGVEYIPNVFGPVLKNKNMVHYPDAAGYKKVAEKIYHYLQERL